MVAQHPGREGAHNERHVSTAGGGRDWSAIRELGGVWPVGVVSYGCNYKPY